MTAMTSNASASKVTAVISASNSRRVRPAEVREPRVRQARGPVARPAGLTMPGGRPAQPASPAVGASVQLVRVAPTSHPIVGAAPGIRLTERALMLILTCIMTLVVAGAIAVATQFLAVSNAPLAENAAYDQAVRVIAQS